MRRFMYQHGGAAVGSTAFEQRVVDQDLLQRRVTMKAADWRGSEVDRAVRDGNMEREFADSRQNGLDARELRTHVQQQRSPVVRIVQLLLVEVCIGDVEFTSRKRPSAGVERQYPIEHRQARAYPRQRPAGVGHRRRSADERAASDGWRRRIGQRADRHSPALQGQQVAVERGDRHPADDVVGLRLVSSIDDRTFALVSQDCGGGRCSIVPRRLFGIGDGQVIQLDECRLDFGDVVARCARRDVRRIVHGTRLERPVTFEELGL